MESKDYLKAARLLATCPTKRLPEVVRLLRESGIEIEDDFWKEEGYDREALRMERRMKRREDAYTPAFWKSDNDFTLLLLDAYKKGIGISKLSRATGMSRTSLYRYLHGESVPSESDKQCILDKIDEIMNRGEK